MATLGAISAGGGRVAVLETTAERSADETWQVDQAEKGLVHHTQG